MTNNMGNIMSIMTRPDSITIVLKNGDRPYTVVRGQPNFSMLVNALRDKDWARVENILTPAVAINRFTMGAVEIVDDRLLFNGEEIRGYLVNKIFEFMNDDLPFEHLVSFLTNLQENPSYRARNELYQFLETENLPITEDGHFLAYKRVRDDWKDLYSGSVLNELGTVVEMPRVGVDDDPTHGCSAGLHAGSLGYVQTYHFGEGRILIVKINPKDVVSVPKHDVRKLRTCRYEVLKEMDEELLFPSYSKDGQTSYGKVPEAEGHAWDDTSYDELYDSMYEDEDEDHYDYDPDFYDDPYDDEDDWDIDTAPEIVLE